MRVSVFMSVCLWLSLLLMWLNSMLLMGWVRKLMVNELNEVSSFSKWFFFGKNSGLKISVVVVV